MGGVDLDKVEACLEGTVRSLTKGLDCGVDAGLIKRLRNGIGGGKRHGAGRNGLPATLGGQEQALASADWGWERHAHAAFSSRMGQLNADAGALGVNEACYSRKGWDVLVLPCLLYTSPNLFWAAQLDAEVIAHQFAAVYLEPKGLQIHWLMRIALLLGGDFCRWLYGMWDQKWHHYSQPPAFYFTFCLLYTSRCV